MSMLYIQFGNCVSAVVAKMFVDFLRSTSVSMRASPGHGGGGGAKIFAISVNGPPVASTLPRNLDHAVQMPYLRRNRHLNSSIFQKRPHKSDPRVLRLWPLVDNHCLFS